MAEIAFYRCTNRRCRFSVRICRDFPVWKPEAPVAIRRLSPLPRHRPLVERYRTEAFCAGCRRVAPDARAPECPRCGGEDFQNEQSGRTCVQCKNGTLAMAHLAVR